MSKADSESETNAEDKKVLDFILKHVVTFTGSYAITLTPPEERHFNFSGFLVSVGDFWYMMTAGHILEELDPALASGQIRFTSRVLADFYGEGATHPAPIPFDYESHTRTYAFKENMYDYAFIKLGYLDILQLKANGRVPFAFDGRYERAWEEYDSFAILGFPTEDVTSNVEEDREGPVTVVVRPGLLPVRLTNSNLPSVVNQIDISGWFIGELVDESRPVSVVGMSGGPIVGFKKNGENLDYWVIAIQSQWYEKRRITLGCPIPFVLSILQESIQNQSNNSIPAAE